MTFVNLCLSIPNLDTLFFYLVFVITIPAYLFSTSNYEALKYYLPGLVMIAVTLTTAGAPNNLFVNLYPTSCTNTSFTGFLSSNTINAMAVFGILAQSLVIASATSSITLGLVSGLITFAITFPLAQQILPFFIMEVDGLRKHYFGNIKVPFNWHMYVAGLLFCCLFLMIQYIMLFGFTKYILSRGIQLI